MRFGREWIRVNKRERKRKIERMRKKGRQNEKGSERWRERETLSLPYSGPFLNASLVMMWAK